MAKAKASRTFAIRPATNDDVRAIVGIYNWAVNQTFATIDSEPLSTEEAADWWEAHARRSRLIVALLALTVAFSVCFAFNGTLLDVVNRPLEHETQKNVDRGRGPLGQIKKVEDGVRGFSERLDTTLALLARPDSGLPRATRALLVRQRARVPAGEAGAL